MFFCNSFVRRECWENMISLEEKEEKDFPIVTLSIYIEKATPFLDEFLVKVEGILYPKKRMHLYLHNSVSFNYKMI